MVGWTDDRRKRWESSTKALAMRCDPELYDQVKAYAEKERLTIAEAIRTLLTIGLVTLETQR